MFICVLADTPRKQQLSFGRRRGSSSSRPTHSTTTTTTTTTTTSMISLHHHRPLPAHRWSQGYLPTLYRPDKKRGKNMSEADRAAFEEQDAQEHTEVCVCVCREHCSPRTDGNCGCKTLPPHVYVRVYAGGAAAGARGRHPCHGAPIYHINSVRHRAGGRLGLRATLLPPLLAGLAAAPAVLTRVCLLSSTAP